MRFRSVVVVGVLLGMGVLFAPLDRADAAATIEVNKLADVSDSTDGVCTLREAIVAANTGVASGAVAGECVAGSTGLDTIVFAYNGKLELNGTTLPTIIDDLTIEGGGVTVVGDSTAGVFSIDGADVTMRKLVIGGGGGVDGAGVHVNIGTLTLELSTITENTASGSGGGIYAHLSTVNVIDSEISKNDAAGGGIYVQYTDLNITNSAVELNTSTTGSGGILARYASTVDIDGSTISRNTTTNGTYAAALTVYDGGVATITDTDISFNVNTPTTGGPRVSAINGGTSSITLNSSSVTNNTSPITTISVGTLTVLNSTISGNSGYGINSGGSDELTVLHSTISNNSLAGIRTYGAGQLTIGGSIIAENTGPDFDIGSNFTGSLTSEGYNIVGDVLDDSGTVVFDPSDLTGVIAPGLEPLADNGGQTQTQALSPGSPAIDFVTSALSIPFIQDQRGISRPQGSASDAGAFEWDMPGLRVLPSECVVYDSDAAGESPFVGGESRVVQVTGTLTGQGGASSCVPAGASSVVFTISSIDPLTEGNLLLTPAGVTATGEAGVVNYGAANGLNNANTVTVPVSAGGAVDVGANAGPAGAVPTTDVRLVAVGFYSPDVDPELKFFPLNPCAVADTRINQGADNSFDGPNDDGLWPVNSVFPDIDVVGVFPGGQGGGNTDCGVPAGADAVMVNVVAVNMEGGSGHLSVGTGGVNPVDEATTPFAVLAPKMNNGATTIVNLGPGGMIAIDVDGDPLASTMIRVEILGYYDNDVAGLDFNGVTPCAVFDTRTNQGAAGSFAGERQHGPTNATTYQIAGDSVPVGQGGVVDTGGGVGSCGVPDGAEAVLINLEAVNAIIEGNFWVSAAGTTTTGGVLNFNNVVPKMNNANAVVVPLNGAGQLDLEINAGNFTPVGTDVAHARGVILGYYN